jgi:AcrR family transcriptional regulator
MAAVRKLTPLQEDRRDQILSSTREMVAEYGYEGMVMSQVAKRANVSPTTLYNLYNTKDLLIMASLRELLGNNAKMIAQSSGGPGLRYLYKSIENGSQMARDNPAYADAIVVALQRASGGDPLVRALLEIGSKDMRVSLDAMAKENQLASAVNTAELGRSLTGVYWSSFILWNKGLLELRELDHALKLNFLSVMVASTVGETALELQALLADLR